MLRRCAACLTALLLLASFEGRGARADTTQSPLKAPPLQPWQVRREQLDHTITGARQNDPGALKQLDQILTELEQHPLGRTPIEVLDIMGTYYVPNEGIESSLSVIVTQLVLGWYDVLRYASASGRAEITTNEQFFKRALVLSGKEVTDKSFKFLKDHPDQASQLVQQGITYAEKFRETSSYDRQWPTAYGMERILCASGEPGKCQAPQALSKDKWDAAWGESKKTVADYFAVKQ